MNARWKFRAVDHNLARRTVSNGRLPVEIVGTDADDLSVTGNLVRSAIESGAIKRIEIESVGPVANFGDLASSARCLMRENFKEDCERFL